MTFLPDRDENGRILDQSYRPERAGLRQATTTIMVPDVLPHQFHRQ
jgi:hypothetical protein